MKMFVTVFAVALGLSAAAPVFAQNTCPDPTVTLTFANGAVSASPDPACVRPGNGNSGTHKVTFIDHTQSDTWSVTFQNGNVCTQGGSFRNGHAVCTVKLACSVASGCAEKYTLTINGVSKDPTIIVTP